MESQNSAGLIPASGTVGNGILMDNEPSANGQDSYYSAWSNSATTGGVDYNDTSEWQLLLFLAQQENFIVRVKGSSLYFGPYSVVTGYVNQTPIPYTWGYDIESLEIERSPHCARDIVVNVYSYNRGSKGKIRATARSTTQYAQRIYGNAGQRQEYIENYTVPGLTLGQAQQMAQSIASQLSRSQLIGQMTAAGNTDLDIDRQIQINGAGKALSVPYYLTQVTHSVDVQGGYGAQVSFCNQFLSSDLTEASA